VLRLGMNSLNDSFKKFNISWKYLLSTYEKAMWQNIIQCIRRSLNFSKLNRKTGLGLVVLELAIDEAERLSAGFPS
jgi:hypothetical protein